MSMRDISEVKNYLIDEAFAGMRLDAYLGAQKELGSRSACVRLIEQGHVFLNGALLLSKSEKLALGDQLQVELPSQKPSYEVEAIQDSEDGARSLDVRYEDEYLAVISKPAGMLSHPSGPHRSNTLSDVLVACYGRDNLGTLQGPDRLGLVHRLDGYTSGLMLIAKDDETQKALQDLIRLRTLDRRYITLVHGNIVANSAMIDVGIARSKKVRAKMSASSSVEAKEAITTFEVLKRYTASAKDEGYTLLECHLYTGRTHQIRVHMQHISHPVVGDPLYGKTKTDMNLGLSRQFLHSWSLDFVHPRLNRRIIVHDELPQDLQSIYTYIDERCFDTTPKGIEVERALKPTVSIEEL